MLVFDTHTQQMVTLSSVYGPIKVSKKSAFWNHLLELNTIIDTPWCLLGDFNELEESLDKEGGSLVSPTQCTKVPLFLHKINTSTLLVLG